MNTVCVHRQSFRPSQVSGLEGPVKREVTVHVVLESIIAGRLPLKELRYVRFAAVRSVTDRG